MSVYRVTTREQARLETVLPLPDKPSRMPFQNMSGDLEEEYFAENTAGAMCGMSPR